MYNGTQHRYAKQNQKHLLCYKKYTYMYKHILRFISDFELNLQYFGYLKKNQDE